MVFQNNILAGVGGQGGDVAYDVPYSCRFNDNDSAKLSHTTGGTPTDASKGVFGTWFKRGNLAGATAGTNASFVAGASESQWIYLDNTDQIYLVDDALAVLESTQVLRDPAAWYHLIMSYDSDEGAAEDRILIWLNGVQVTSWDTDARSSRITSGEAWGLTVDAATKVVGALSTSHYWDGYLAQTFLVDGTSIQNGDHSIGSFGEFNNNVWRPIDITGLTFGTNGWLLDYADSSDLGNDVSGNDNDFTSSGLAAADQMDDTPTKNWCTLLPIREKGTITYSDGNLEAVGAVASQSVAAGSISATSGKFIYASRPASRTTNIGEPYLVNEIYNAAGMPDLSSASNAWGIKLNTSSTWIVEKEGTGTTITHGFSGGWEDGVDFLIICFDVDNLKIWCGGYDVSAGVLAFVDGSTGVTGDPGAGTDPTDTISGTRFTGVFDFWSARAASIDFGQSILLSQITIPTDFKFLNTDNLTESTIKNSKKYFDTILYEGNGLSQKVGQFQPITETYSVGNSALFKADDQCELDKTFSTTASSTKKGTLSVWVKPNNADMGVSGGVIMMCDGTSGDIISIDDSTGKINVYLNNYSNGRWTSAQSIQDPAQWTNLIVAFELDNGTATDRIQVYVDGVNITDDGTFNNAFTDSAFNMCQDTIACTIGGLSGTFSASYIYDGYMAEYVWCDGQVLTPSSYGEVDSTTNRWIPKDVSGLTFGNNGFYLDFADENDLGDDESGNTNDWTESGFDTTNGSNQFYDTPTNNFAVMGDLKNSATLPGAGRLSVTSSGSGYFPILATIPMYDGTGKWVWETQLDQIASEDPYGMSGVAGSGMSLTASATGVGWTGINLGEGSQYIDGTVSAGVTAPAVDDILRWEYDSDTRQLAMINVTSTGAGYQWPKQGIVFGENPVYAMCAPFGVTLRAIFPMNFGQQNYVFGAATTFRSDAGGYFNSTPTADYKALKTDNLTESDSFQSAFSWIKNRDALDSHMLFDRVRGPFSFWHSDTDADIADDEETLIRFLKQGANIGDDDRVNTFNESFVYWDWFIETTGSGSANGDGSITTASTLVDTTGGTSISKFEGTGSNDTVGHGLGAAPKFVILKHFDNTSNSTTTWHNKLDTPTTGYLILDATDGEQNNAAVWNSTIPTSSVVSLGTSAASNNSGTDYMMYCFAEIEGFSSFGRYEGNGNTSGQGPFCYTGFQPEFVIFKNIDRAVSWMAMTAKFGPNPNKWELLPDTNGVMGATYPAIDFLSNGFRIVNTVGYYAVNWSGESYVWCAWAKNPFGGESTTPSTAF